MRGEGEGGGRRRGGGNGGIKANKGERITWTNMKETHTCTGFSFSHSCRSSVVFCSTALSSATICICSVPIWACTDDSFRFTISLKAPHSPSTLSTYTQLLGNWNRCLSRIFSPALNTSTCCSQERSFLFSSCMRVMNPTASEVVAASTTWFSRSERYCDGMMGTHNEQGSPQACLV